MALLLSAAFLVCAALLHKLPSITAFHYGLPSSVCLSSPAQRHHQQQSTIQLNNNHVKRSSHSHESSTTTTQLHGFLNDLLENFNQDKEDKVTQYAPIDIEPDFRVAAFFLIPGLILDTVPYFEFTLGPILTLLGIFLTIQTPILRFAFDESNSFVLKVKDSERAGPWNSDKVVNYDFFPRSWMAGGPLFGQPILVYFKETQTDPKQWNIGPGKLANDPEKIASGKAIPGQPHFFPAVCNAQQLRSEFEKRKWAKF